MLTNIYFEIIVLHSPKTVKPNNGPPKPTPMKYISLLLFYGTVVHTTVNGQHSESLKKRQNIFEFGYIGEHIVADGSVLKGFEGQIKVLFKPQELSKGEKLDGAGYFNVGCSIFGSSTYDLNQWNMGVGFIAPIFWNAMRMDLGVGAVYHYGSIGEDMWFGKKIDFGFNGGISIPFNRSFGIYCRYSAPSGITMLAGSDNYIPPMFLSAGISLEF